MALTDTAIKNVKPKAKPYKLADEKGLHLLVRPSGGLLWRMKYRADGADDQGRPKRVEKLLSFGSYPAITLKDARDHPVCAISGPNEKTETAHPFNTHPE